MIEVIFHFILVLVSFFFGEPPNAERDALKSYQHTCQDISNAISSSSAVYYPGERSFVLSKHFSNLRSWPTGSGGYANGTFYWSVTSTQPSACTVEPGSAEDVGKIVSCVIVSVECHAYHRCSYKF